MKNFVFGANYDFVKKHDESCITTIMIPAVDDFEAATKLIFIVGKSNAKHFSLHDVREY